MTASRHVALLVNPERDELGDDVRSALSGVSPRPLEPSSADHIVDSVRQAARQGADTVVAVGGDGTQRSVADGVVGTNTALGVIPGGTVNLLAQVLGLADVDDAVAAILRARRRTIDVGRCNSELFVLNASSGFDAATIAAAATGHKARFGRLTFLRAAVSALRSSRSHHVEVVVDNEAVFSGRAMSVIITNVAARSSADFRIAPDALFDDGRLDVLIVRASTVAGMVRLAWTLARHGTPRRSDLLRAAGANIDVTWSRPVDGQVDGEPLGRARHFAHQVEAGRLHVNV